MKSRAPSSSWGDVHGAAYPALKENHATEVLVIGGGLCGVLSAYALAHAGKKVTLIEKKGIGLGITGYTTAFITAEIDTDFSDLTESYGEKTAALIWRSGTEAIARIEEITKAEKIDCDFVRVPAYLYANTKKEHESLLEDYTAMKRLRLPVSSLSALALPFRNCGAIHVKDQAKFHPLKFLHGLADRAKKAGVSIFENTEAETCVPHANGVRVTTKNGLVIEAENAILATYDPLDNPPPFPLKKAMYVSYVLEVAIDRGLFEEGIYWDAANPYHYFRIDAGDEKDRMILGGEDHRKDIPVPYEKNMATLKDYLKDLMGKNRYRLENEWQSEVLEPVDGLPLIGRTETPHLYAAAGFSGNGMTYSALAAEIFRDLILNNKNPYAALYDPSRKLEPKRLYRKGLDYVGELMGGALKNAFRQKKPPF